MSEIDHGVVFCAFGAKIRSCKGRPMFMDSKEALVPLWREKKSNMCFKSLVLSYGINC